MSQYTSKPNGTYQGQQQGSYYPEAPQFAHGQQAGTPSPYESHQQYGENASYYHDNGAFPGAEEGPENEKGLGSTVAGGAAGGYAAHHMGGGKLATAGGAVLGAVGMNMVSHKFKQHNDQLPAQPFTGAPVMAAPAPGATTVTTTTTTTGDGLGGRLGLGGGLVGGRARQRIARRRLGL